MLISIHLHTHILFGFLLFCSITVQFILSTHVFYLLFCCFFFN